MIGLYFALQSKTHDYTMGVNLSEQTMSVFVVVFQVRSGGSPHMHKV